MARNRLAPPLFLAPRGRPGVVSASHARSAQRTLREGCAPVGSAVRTSDRAASGMAGSMVNASSLIISLRDKARRSWQTMAQASKREYASAATPPPCT